MWFTTYHILFPQSWYFSTMVLKFLGISLSDTSWFYGLLYFTVTPPAVVISDLHTYSSSKLLKIMKKKICILKHNGIPFEIGLNNFDTVWMIHFFARVDSFFLSNPSLRLRGPASLTTGEIYMQTHGKATISKTQPILTHTPTPHPPPPSSPKKQKQKQKKQRSLKVFADGIYSSIKQVHLENLFQKENERRKQCSLAFLDTLSSVAREMF